MRCEIEIHQEYECDQGPGSTSNRKNHVLKGLKDSISQKRNQTSTKTSFSGDTSKQKDTGTTNILPPSNSFSLSTATSSTAERSLQQNKNVGGVDAAVDAIQQFKTPSCNPPEISAEESPLVINICS